ncbi:MAG: tetratricopeptide repeat protein, partial [Bacteroidota bacterium]
MTKVIYTFVLLFFAQLGIAQDAKLAQQYFKDGEYEKAATVYESLYKKNERNDYYFDQYIESLLALEQYEEAEKTIKKQLKKNPKAVKLYVTYGNLFERKYEDDAAQKQYETAIKKLPADRFAIIKLANAFVTLTKFDLAIKTYEQGIQLLNDAEIFAYNLGDLYRRKGDNPKMIEHYLNSLNANPSRLNSLKTLFQRYLAVEDFDELQQQLYTRIQNDREAIHYPELLTWVFIQKKDYPGALRQVRALDRRLKENGGRVYRIAQIAANDTDYDTAIDAYSYIVDNKGVVSTFYIDAKRETLRCKRQKLVAGYDYTEEQLRDLEQEYVQFLDEFGRSSTTASIVAELAELEAFYLNDLPQSIALLNEMIDYAGIDQHVQAEGKISLADFYLMRGERWESTLLYSQVDKTFKDDILGHEARFRNAKLSYFMGDFEWAQAQFDILKASTSKLIANDALDLSIFIMDNLGLDTTAVPLQMYADAELLVFQNRFEETFSKLDSIKTLFPKHGLEDDILYLKAQVHVKQRQYEEAAKLYTRIAEEFTAEIRADNALFALAQLYENQLNNKEEAMRLYEKIFIDFSNSTFAVEARKKFRVLRGDNL